MNGAGICPPRFIKTSILCEAKALFIWSFRPAQAGIIKKVGESFEQEIK